jgi:hypothetical protein
LSAGAANRRRKAALLLLAALSFASALYNLGWVATSAMGGGVDFNQFYSGARLTGTGHLYDYAALRQLEKGHGRPVPCGRLPVVTFALKPLTLIGYVSARYLWLAISLAALVGFAWLWPGIDRRLLLAALAWSAPASCLLILGQDTPLWLVAFAAGLLLLERGKPRLAGVAFALCLSKYHLALAIPVFLVAQRRWQTLAAGGATVAVLLAVCFPIEGLAWPQRYWAIVRNPLFSPADVRMPNLRGMAYWLPATPVVEAIAAAVLVVLLWRVCRGTNELGMAGAATAACGLLLGHHAYGADATLLIPLAVLMLWKPWALWMRVWAALLLTPVFIWLLFSSYSGWAQALAVCFVFAALILETRRASAAQTGAASCVTLPAV